MGVEVSYCAIHLAEEVLCRKVLHLPREALLAVCHFFTQGSRRSRLAMRSRQHGLPGVSVGKLHQAPPDLLQLRHQLIVVQILQHEGVRQVIDVLGSACKVQEFAVCRKPWQFRKSLFQVVLHRFHRGWWWTRSYPGCLCWREFLDDVVWNAFAHFIQRCGIQYPVQNTKPEPAELHDDAPVD
jgi:hypothetical protein